MMNLSFAVAATNVECLLQMRHYLDNDNIRLIST